MADRSLVLELAETAGEPVRIEWDLDALGSVGRSDAPERPFELRGLDSDRWELARVLSAAFADGRLLAIASLRPRDAAGHGEEATGGALVRDGEAATLDEALLSVEYGPDRKPRRLGLELYERPESLPLRIAGDRTGRSGAQDATFELRAGDVEGVALLAMVAPG